MIQNYSYLSKCHFGFAENFRVEIGLMGQQHKSFNSRVFGLHKYFDKIQNTRMITEIIPEGEVVILIMRTSCS